MTNAEFRSRIASLATLDNLDPQTIDDEWVRFSIAMPQGVEQIHVHREESRLADDVMIEFTSGGLHVGHLPQPALHSFSREFMERNSVAIFAFWAYGPDADGNHALWAVSRIPARILDQQRFRRCIGAILAETSFLLQLSTADGTPVIRPLNTLPKWRK